jgi:protein subunit release factor A
MRFKEAAKPVNIDGMQQCIDGVRAENEGHHHPNDIEAAVRIMHRTVKPIFIHIVCGGGLHHIADGAARR